MCPLRLILIFLSATLAGFFVLKNLKSQPQILEDPSEDSANATSDSSAKPDSVNRSTKFLLSKRNPQLMLLNVGKCDSLDVRVLGVMKMGFWTCVDMASGRYLWRNLVSSTPSASKRSS